MMTQEQARELADQREDWFIIGPSNQVPGPYREHEARTIAQARALQGERVRLLRCMEYYVR